MVCPGCGRALARRYSNISTNNAADPYLGLSPSTNQFNCWAGPNKVQTHLIRHLDFRADKDCPVNLFFALAGYFPSRHRPLPGNSQAQSWLTGWSMSTLPPGYIQTRFLAQKPVPRTLASLVASGFFRMNHLPSYQRERIGISAFLPPLRLVKTVKVNRIRLDKAFVVGLLTAR
jgi:hypothetical protein